VLFNFPYLPNISVKCSLVTFLVRASTKRVLDSGVGLLFLCGEDFLGDLDLLELLDLLLLEDRDEREEYERDRERECERDCEFFDFLAGERLLDLLLDLLRDALLLLACTSFLT